MTYGGKELAGAFRTVRKNTIQVAEDIPESKYSHVAAPEARSVAGMLSHVAIATRLWIEMSHRAPRSLVGFDFLKFVEPIKAEEAKPRTKPELLELLRTEGEKFATWLETLTPEFLAETITEPDGKTQKSRLERILGAKEHEMHHRGQLMLIERQLGITPHLTRQFNERVAQMRAAQAQTASVS
ncbi:MAG TPA: DinB family protein [Candidatus Acidoferrales bacterium]|nr:DinB family protein [Candidatus Acidoferrales bacterium]